MIKAFQHHLARVASRHSLPYLFPKIPTIPFTADVDMCCGKHLGVLKTRKRTLANMSIGTLCGQETILKCSLCCKIYTSNELRQITPQQGKFGFDVIEYIGRALFVDYRNEREIQKVLRGKNIIISRREIGNLGRKFIIYLALAHQESEEALNKHLHSRGGYILHLDGTCEGNSPHLMSFIDEISNIVLGNIKMPTENSIYIAPYLERLKKTYGTPIAAVHDMGKGILTAVEKVFPGIKDFICHFHFLRDIGKDMFGTPYRMLERYLRTHGVRGKLQTMKRNLRKTIEDDDNLRQSMNDYLSCANKENATFHLDARIKLYVLVCWVLDANSQSNGFGFPFDKPHLDFYYRLNEASIKIKEFAAQLQSQPFNNALNALKKTIRDKSIAHAASLVEERSKIFEKLRNAMRIAKPENNDGLNDEGDTDIKTIEARVKKFRDANEIKLLANQNICYKKMLKQIDQYWDKLFADPISVDTPEGKRLILPQRTNNILEQFFRSLKSSARRKTGTKSLSKILKTMLADTPLIKNLSNPEYMKIILNGKCSLAERFACIETKKVRAMLSQAQESVSKYPKGMSSVLKISNLPKLLRNKLPAGVVAT